ncbi:MAG: hypothetical protein ABR587_06155 [Candidatus Binatia bacterium]
MEHFSCRLPAILLATMVGAFEARAHDPGLSFTSVSLSSKTLSATMNFHDADVAKPGETGGPHPSPLVVRINGRTFEAQRVERRDDGGHAIIELQFERLPEESFELVVTLLTSLPRGHKHHVEVRDDSGSIVASAILSAGAETLRVPRTAARGGAPVPSAAPAGDR